MILKKKINVKPVTELELCFEDGKTIELVFNTESLMYFTEIGEITDISKLTKTSLPELCSKIVYAGAVVKDGSFTLEEARKIVSNLDIGTVTEIIQEFTGNMDTGENKAELQKNLMREFLLTME
jgi:hypothetical protein